MKTLLLAAAVAASPQTELTLTLMMRGLVVGSESWTPHGTGQTFRTRFEFVRKVDLAGELELDEKGKVLSLEVSGNGYPWLPVAGRGEGPRPLPIRSPFPVAMLGVAVREWENEGWPSRLPTANGDIEIAPCGEGCYAIQGLSWGRSIVWLADDGSFSAAFVPTPFAPLVALPKGRETDYGSVLAAAGRAGLKSVSSLESTRGKIAITGARVLDPGAGSAREATVVLNGGRIEAITRRDLAPPPDAQRIDATGLTLLPGLWDMHAHAKQVEWLPAYLASGVTTVRDLGNEFEFLLALREGIAENSIAGPRLLAAGFIDATPSQGAPYTSYVADSAEEGRALVRRYRDAGFEGIKVWSNVSAEALKATAAEAHALGLEVTGHVPQALTLEEAIPLGLDQVDHVGYVTDALSRGDLRPTLRERHIVVDPTLVVSRYATRPRNVPLASYEPCARWMPEELVQVWSAFGVDPEDAAASEAQLERALATVKALHAAGIPIVAGSDQGLPGCTLILELELYVRAGLSPLDALRSATIVSAKVMGVADDVGSVAVGQRADLILVEGNPLEDIRALRNLRFVIRDGVVLDPAQLRALANLAPRN